MKTMKSQKGKIKQKNQKIYDKAIRKKKDKTVKIKKKRK